MTPNIEELRQTHIFCRKDLASVDAFEFARDTPRYDWEHELQMALLAREAKQLVKNRGLMA